jgi:hypothetical protein
MKKEIRRNQWSRFCRQFSARNQYRPARLRVQSGGQQEQVTDETVPFLGMDVEKKGRLIDGIRIVGLGHDADALAHPLMSLKQPSEVLVESDKTGVDKRLVITAKDGSRATVDLTEGADPEIKQRLVERIAYSIYEKSGGSHGHDINHWLEAENRVVSTEKAFV